MDHRSTAASLAQDFFTRHGMPPVKPYSGPDSWMQPVLEQMRRGSIGSGTVDHSQVLTAGYVAVLLAGACRVTDNVAAVDFAGWAADDLVMRYLLLCRMRGALDQAPGSMAEQRTALMQTAVSSVCSSTSYPRILAESIEPFLGNRPRFRISTNADSTTVFPASFDFGLPSSHIATAPPSPESEDITDASPQFQLFFKGCSGSLRRGISLDPMVLNIMQQLGRAQGIEQLLFDAVQQRGSHAPRPKHDYATPGEYILVNMMSVGSFTTCVFAKARFDPPMVYPDWKSWSIHLGGDTEHGTALTGDAALRAMMQCPEEYAELSPVQELELWPPNELPTWIAYQASWSARRGMQVAPRHYRTLSLEQYLS